MKILISPAKGFKNSSIKPKSIPMLIDKTIDLNNILKEMNIDDIVTMLKVKKDVAELNFLRYKEMMFDINGYSALFSFDGLQYKNMNLEDFNDEDIEFCYENILIMSGYYGILKTLDSIYPHRLDFLTKFKTEQYKNLYDFWGDSIAKSLLSIANNDEIILNLSSNEFFKSINKHIPNNKIINCVFKVEKNSKLSVQSTASKQARGQMVNYIVKNKITNIDGVKNFDRDGYIFSQEYSTDTELVFIKYTNS